MCTRELQDRQLARVTCGNRPCGGTRHVRLHNRTAPESRRHHRPCRVVRGACANITTNTAHIVRYLDARPPLSAVSSVSTRNSPTSGPARSCEAWTAGIGGVWNYGSVPLRRALSQALHTCPALPKHAGRLQHAPLVRAPSTACDALARYRLQRRGYIAGGSSGHGPHCDGTASHSPASTTARVPADARARLKRCQWSRCAARVDDQLDACRCVESINRKLDVRHRCHCQFSTPQIHTSIHAHALTTSEATIRASMCATAAVRGVRHVDPCVVRTSRDTCVRGWIHGWTTTPHPAVSSPCALRRQ